MKPDWKYAPEWANWLAMDEDQEWWWHENKPVIESCVFASQGRMLLVKSNEWKDTLEQRPEPS